MTPTRKALNKEASKYGDRPGKPFVVALASARPFADAADVLDALFGDDVYLADASTL